MKKTIKTRKTRRNKNKKTRRGGVRRKNNLELNEKQDFHTFLENSSVDKDFGLKHGVTGLIIKLNFDKDESLNPYLHTDESIKDTPVTSFILKLCLVSTESRNAYIDKDFENYFIDKENIKFSLVKLSYFEEEIKIQNDIYNESFRNTKRAICPAIAYTGIYELNDKKIMDKLNNFNDTIIFKDITLNETFNKLKGLLEEQKEIVKESFKLGVIMMQVADGYESLGSILKKSNDEKVIMKCAYAIFELFLMNYDHGDFHSENVLYKKDETGFFEGESGRPMLIDFGQTTKIDKKLEKVIITDNQLFDYFIKHLVDLCGKKEKYVKWICDLLNKENTRNSLLNLFNKRFYNEITITDNYLHNLFNPV